MYSMTIKGPQFLSGKHDEEDYEKEDEGDMEVVKILTLIFPYNWEKNDFLKI